MTNERCTQCGALIALVGRVHRCVVRETKPALAVLAQPKPAEVTTLAKRPRAAPGTALYRFRNADKWRAYQRDLMRKRRAKA